MKRFFVVAVSILLLAACSRNAISPVDKSLIRFCVDKISTKGETVTLANLNAFEVTGVTASDTYFSRMRVTSPDGGKTWVSEDKYFWPLETLHFFAWAGVNGTVIVSHTDHYVKDFSVPADIDAQKDFVVASASRNGVEEGQDEIALQFEHATASVSLMAASWSDIYNVKVYGVKFGNLRDKDTFTFPSDGEEVISGNWNSWSETAHTSSTETDFKYIYTDPVILGNEPRSVTSNKSFFFIPQQLDAWKSAYEEPAGQEMEGAYISLLVEITTKEGAPVYPKNEDYIKEGVHAAWDAVGTNLHLEAGIANTFCINFFKDGGAGQQDPENPEEDGEGGAPILGGPLSLTISVDPWTEGDTHIINVN